MNFSVPPPFNNNPIGPPPSPFPACPSCAVCPVCPVCPSPLDGMSCVRWGNTQKLTVGIIGGCLAGVMVSVAITFALLKKQYKFKKIVSFSNNTDSV